MPGIAWIGEKRSDGKRVRPSTEDISVRPRDTARIVCTYNILMRIHVNPEAILFAFPQYANSVVHEVIVIDPAGKSSVRESDGER
jgi:hypothetical protein